MKFKIIVDSSANLNEEYIKDSEVGFEVVPLTLRINDKEYIDDDTLDTFKLLEEINKSEEVPHSSCPSPNDFLNALDIESYNFIITISSKLSGSFNSALVASNMFEKPQNVFVIDSKSAAGTLILLVDKLYEYIKKGMSFVEISTKIIEYRKSMELLFALNKFDNLVKNGRISKVVALIANLAKIRPLCYADDGEIKIKEKIRTFKGVLKRLVFNIGKLCPNQEDRTCIISHTLNLEDASILKKEIEETYNFKEVRIVENRGLCSFYSLEGGIIVCF